MKKILTLLIIHKDDKVLLGFKKRGFGVGKWNGFGGKVNDGESIENAAKRELFEESGLTVSHLEKIGVLDFSWVASAKALVNQVGQILQVHIFKVVDFFGQPQETEEMKPQWFNIDAIPFESMWVDDKYWFPLFLAGKKFKGAFVFNSDNAILEYRIDES